MQDTAEVRTAHLSLVQAVITRMAQNSFLLKGWAVTLVAALFAVAAADTREQIALLGLLPALVFWGLDAYYLRQERLFRALYDFIRSCPEGSLGGRVLSMDTRPYDGQVKSWLATLLSPTVAFFHGAVVAAVGITTGVLAA
jgi:hypothetical protein